MSEFANLIRDKVEALRVALSGAAKDEPLADSLLRSMKQELDDLETGAIEPPYSISRWGVYVGEHYPLLNSHPEITEAFGELEIVLDHCDMESYLRTRNYLQELARPHRK